MSVTVHNVRTSNTGTTSASFTPIGLTEGDLMIVITAAANNASVITRHSGFSNIAGGITQTYGVSDLCYKVATAGDVSGGTFTFTSSSGNIIGVMYRISGHADPSLLKISLPATPPAIDNHVIIAKIGSDNDGTLSPYSGYSVTGGTSVTFTERFDGGDDAGLDISMGVADGSYQSASAITAISITDNSSLDDSDSFIVLIPAQANATASNALFQTSPVTFATLTGSTQEPGNDFFEVSPNFPEQSGVVNDKTVWSNSTKPTTSWTNTAKL